MKFKVPVQSGELEIDIELGGSVIFVGANGSGKSRLAIKIEKSLGELSHRISAHRALNLNTSIPKIKEDMALKTLKYGAYWDGISIDHRESSRWSNKSSTLLLNDFDSVIQALFADQSKTALASHNILTGKCSGLAKRTKFETLEFIWERLIPHRELVIDGDDVRVKSLGSSDTYSASDMSDGERAIFYLIGQVLVADSNSVLIIDEPELHIHRSIMSSLWDQLESIRQDCSFIFITHDIEFAASRIAKKFAIKNYQENGPAWELEEIPEDTGFPEELTTVILGSRKPILFVEGDDTSLDKALYRSVYPDWTIIPRGSCQDVVHAVTTLRNNSSLTRINCAGIIDADGHSEQEVGNFHRMGIKVLPVSEIENIFLIPSVSREIALTDNYDDIKINEILDKLLDNLISLISSSNNLEDCVLMYCKRRIDKYLKRVDLSDADSLLKIKEAYNEKTSELDIGSMYQSYKQKLNEAIEERNMETLLSLFDNKGMLAKAGLTLKGKSKVQFEEWLIRVLTISPDGGIVNEVRAILPELPLYP